MQNHERRMVPFIKNDGQPLRALKKGRNEPCGCGSGKKSKHCCNSETKYYHSKK